MEEDHKTEIEEIMGEMQCPKNFICYESGLETLCRARDIGVETFLECLEEPPLECQFSIPFGNTRFCHCPLRIYIAKELKK